MKLEGIAMKVACKNAAEEYLETRVTFHQEGWLVAVVDTRSSSPCYPLGEVIVKDRAHISPAIEELLRWHDKCGGTSPMASASRARGKYRPPDSVRYRGKRTIFSWVGDPCGGSKHD